MKRKAIVKLLKDLADGQGYAQLSCFYDSHSGATFGIMVNRERDGLTFGPKENIPEDEFYILLDRLLKG